MRKVTTSGKCSLCNDTFTKGAMANHLRACRGAHPQALLGKGNERTARLFHVTVEGRTRPDYWLHLEAPADATLADLDAFLRGIWLECCGHLSAFAIGRDAYSVAPEELGERSMAVPLERVFGVGTSFRHEYDFGTPTELSLKVVGERQGLTRDNSIQVLARNGPPPMRCGECGRPATQVCTGCMSDDEGWLCNACAREHACGEDMLLPVVNSPRVGMCGYSG